MARSSTGTCSSTPSIPRTTRSWAPRCRRSAAAEQSGFSLPEDSIPAIRLASLAFAVIAGVAVPRLHAQEDDQDKKDEESLNRVWRIDGLQTGFCVQLLVDPSRLDVSIPRASRALKAEAMDDLSPVLRTVIANQPEVASWTPSSICLYFMESVDVGSLTVTERDPRKRPMLGIWTLAAADAADGVRKDVVLQIFTNSGRLERAGQVNGLDIHTIRSTVDEIENEETPEAPPIGIQYQIKLGKTLLTWNGRRVSDSTRAGGPVSADWRADSRRRGPMTARLLLLPDWTQPMVGSLQIEGEDDFAKAVMASPIRFVGPAVMGGGGELAFGR